MSRIRDLRMAVVVATVALGCGSTPGRLPKSSYARVEQRVGRVLVTIEYNRPVARGRRLFGGIVPYDKVWHPGADAASTIAFGTLDLHPQPRRQSVS